MSKDKDTKRGAKRFREEGLCMGAWRGCAGRGGDGEDEQNGEVTDLNITSLSCYQVAE